MVYIFLQEGYDPIPDPNSICTMQLIEELEKRNEKWFVICDGPIGYEKQFSKENRIIHVSNKKNEVFNKSSWFEKIKIIISRSMSIPIWPIRFPKKVKKYINQLELLIANQKLDYSEIVLISVYRPAEMIEIGYHFKKKNKDCKWIIYNLDGLDSNVEFICKEIFQKKETCWQLSRYREADLIFQMQTHLIKYKNTKFYKYMDKTIFVDYPLLVKNDSIVGNSNFSDFNLLYSGSFYKTLREPFFMINWYEELVKYKKIDFRIYTRNDFLDYIVEKEKETGGAIKRFDYVTNEEMNKIIMKNNILVSIGNGESEMVPSKIFVYMSSCKPIIHFYRSDKDSCLPYLKSYPYALLLDEREGISECVAKAIDFFGNLDSKLDYDGTFNMLAKKFYKCTPSSTIDKLISFKNY